MLLAIVIANLIWILPLCLIFALAGFIFRSTQIGKLRGRIKELEAEMLQNHADILALQKENTQLSDKLKNNSVPVIPITGSGKENTSEPMPDVSARKKLLGSSANKHS
jgi:hypothetical protein